MPKREVTTLQRFSPEELKELLGLPEDATLYVGFNDEDMSLDELFIEWRIEK